MVPGYYVSAVDGTRYAFPAGPFQTHDEAIAAVEPTKAEWVDKDPRASNSWELRQAVARAEAQQGRKVNAHAVASGLHSHDGGKNWEKH